MLFDITVPANVINNWFLIQIVATKRIKFILWLVVRPDLALTTMPHLLLRRGVVIDNSIIYGVVHGAMAVIGTSKCRLSKILIFLAHLVV